MENIRSILLTRNTRNAARSIHKDGVRRGFETNADCYSMTRGNLEITNLAPGGEGWGPAFLFVSLYKNLHPDPVSGNCGRRPTRLRTPQPRRHRCEAAASVGYAHAPGGEATMAGRAGDKMAGRGAWRQWRHRRLPRFCSDAVPHRLAQCAHASFCYRARRGGVGDAGDIEPACTDAPDGAPPPWGTQRRTRHRRMTTVSSTSGGFHRRRRRRRLLRGRQAAGRGTTFGAGCAAQRAASAPSPPHVHSTRARSAPSIRAAGTSWPEFESPSAAPP